TKLNISVDNTLAYASTSGNFSTILNVSTGKHTILVKGWDNKGIGIQAATYITASGSGNGFYVASPMVGTTVDSSVHFSVNAASVTSHSLASTTLYVDKVAVYTTHTTVLDTTTTLAAGKRTILLESVDTAGAKNDLTFTLNVNASAPPPPPPPALQITTSSTLPDDTAGVSYLQALVASGGSGTKTWSITSGALPAGLSLQASGTITGATNAAAGQFQFTA